MASSDKDDKTPPELKYLRIALSALMFVAALAGLVLFMSAVNRHAPVMEAVEYFIPTLFVFALLQLSNFMNLMMLHDLQTWLFVLLTIFALFFLLPEALTEKDPARAAYWFSAFTGVLGFAMGIPIGRMSGRKSAK